MQIGIISDTHGHFPDSIHDCFKNVSHIFHAGDIGNEEVILELETICPVSAIHGNADSWPIVHKYPATLFTEISGTTVNLIHDIGSIKYYSYQLFRKGIGADIVIYGHTHKPHSELFQKTLFINPGTASRPKFGDSGTVAIVDLEMKPFQTHFIELPSMRVI